MSSNNIDDAAFARMLQELENEEARRHSQRNLGNNPPATAPVRSFSGTAETSATSSSSIENDEEYARRVQEEMNGHVSNSPPVMMDVDIGFIPEQAPPYHSSSQQDDDDVQLALKVEQEMRDEEIARQLEIQDQNAAAAARRASRSGQSAAARPARAWTCRRILTLAIPVAIAVGVGIVLYLVFSGNADSIPFLGPNENDPFNGKNPDDLTQWKTNDVGGLDLELLNALDDTWQSEFLVAMRDWENGDPDALTLTTQQIAPESLCTPVSGKMKVCNGNYGDTGWRGINQISISNGWITQSIAKLNEYYLIRSSEGDRQYTMCHEIGHGFGLPHTDEIFGNPDLGNCMDYTNNPERNKQPDESNYQLLAEFYGTVDGSWPPGNSTRHLSDQEPGDCSSPEVMARYNEVAAAFERGLDEEPEGWIPVHKNTFGKAGRINLGDGCGMEVRLLLA